MQDVNLQTRVITKIHAIKLGLENNQTSLQSLTSVKTRVTLYENILMYTSGTIKIYSIYLSCNTATVARAKKFILVYYMYFFISYHLLIVDV